ncbi:helix-turn-helix domain-containing protein [Microbacterium hydrothermale]|uniref:helix-turn-helix domain-containing protein n=1 Tax=Microbacterium hydrothermale TaxID=857427 RepID=UPI0010A87608|nr:helix-turn-helix transcriptional regulator [Microbacterium hydrothermale]
MPSLEPNYPWMSYMQEFGANLRRTRLAAGMTQETVALRASISLFTYQKLEKGESNPGTPANPRLQTLLALSAVLGVDVQELVPDLDRWHDVAV